MKILHYDENNITVLDESFNFKSKKVDFEETTLKTTSMFLPMNIHPVFNSNHLKAILRRTISSIRSAPIEYEEIRLYKATQYFISHLRSSDFDIEVFGKIHHLLTLQTRKFSFKNNDLAFLSTQISEITSNDPYVFQKYKLLSKLLDISGRLMIKWRIFHTENYEFRYTGRGLNVKLLDLEKISSSILSPDTFWFSFGVFTKPLNELVDVSICEVAKVLKDAARELFFFMLTLNAPNPTYKIKETVAYNSLKYKKFNTDVIPEKDIEGFKHISLRLKRGFFSRCLMSQPSLDLLYEKLEEFELAFRSFEKELIVTLLGVSKYINT